MDQPGDVAQIRCPLDERMYGIARGCIDRCDAHIVSGVAQNLRRCVGVVRPHVGQQNMLPHANPAHDRLTNLTRADHDNYISHSYSFRDCAVTGKADIEVDGQNVG